MKISFAATNPCHVYEWARALYAINRLGTYYSGYPKSRLAQCPANFPLKTFPARTLLTYGALRWIPRRLRPADHHLFRWQDAGFDRAVARSLTSCTEIHGLPGQCESIFSAARAKGIPTVLNHATGPTRDLEKRVRKEFDRVGVRWEDHTPYTEAFRAREDREWALADQHCVASMEVRDQLVHHGIASKNIRVVPYGADPSIFHPASEPTPSEGTFRILFAGQASLRKGLHTVWQALGSSCPAHWRMDHVGSFPPEIDSDWRAAATTSNLHRHGSVSRSKLADFMRKADVLVLPSWEEGFGLVVVQALACGTPCLVSDRVGARDLIKPGVNGEIVPTGDPFAWREALERWAEREATPVFDTHFGWDTAAEKLVASIEPPGAPA